MFRSDKTSDKTKIFLTFRLLSEEITVKTNIIIHYITVNQQSLLQMHNHFFRMCLFVVIITNKSRTQYFSLALVGLYLLTLVGHTPFL